MSENHDFQADVGAQRLAAVYAQSLLNAADKADAVDTVLEELDSLVDEVFLHAPSLEVVFSGAAVGRVTRTRAIEQAFASASPVFQNFLLVLNDQERLGLVRPIRRALHELVDERRRRIKVNVYSAVPLAHEQNERIREGVRQRFQLEPVLVPHVDPALLGGLKLRIGDRQFDATVRARIDNLRNQLLARSSHEIQTERDRFSSD